MEQKAATEGSLLQTVTWSVGGRCSSGHFSNLLLLSVTLYAIFRVLWKKKMERGNAFSASLQRSWCRRGRAGAVLGALGAALVLELSSQCVLPCLLDRFREDHGD